MGCSCRVKHLKKRHFDSQQTQGELQIESTVKKLIGKKVYYNLAAMFKTITLYCAHERLDEIIKFARVAF